MLCNLPKVCEGIGFRVGLSCPLNQKEMLCNFPKVCEGIVFRVGLSFPLRPRGNAVQISKGVCGSRV